MRGCCNRGGTLWMVISRMMRTRNAILPNFHVWINSGINFWITQILSSHRSFGSYLYKIKKVDSAMCIVEMTLWTRLSIHCEYVRPGIKIGKHYNRRWARIWNCHLSSGSFASLMNIGECLLFFVRM